jgi:hypothetical protein
MAEISKIFLISDELKLFKFFSSKTIVAIGTKLCKNNPCEVLYTDDTFVLMLKKDGHH